MRLQPAATHYNEPSSSEKLDPCSIYRRLHNINTRMKEIYFNAFLIDKRRKKP